MSSEIGDFAFAKARAGPRVVATAGSFGVGDETLAGGRSGLSSHSPQPASFTEAFRAVTASALHTAAESTKPLNVLSPVTTARASNPNAVLVNKCQTGNPLLAHVRSVPWEWADVLPDYVMGDTACALYLSIRYHMLHPKYLHARIGLVKHLYRVRVLLCHVDVDDNERPLEELTKIAFINNWTLVCVWSFEEAARYIETFKSYEKKSAELIKEHVEDDQKSQLRACLGEIRSVNKKDVATLAVNFASVAGVANATAEELAACPGLGEKKVRRIWNAFHRPFASLRSSRISRVHLG